VTRGMGGGLDAGGTPSPSAMKLSGAVAWESIHSLPQSTVPKQQQATTTSPASGTDPFADLAGLF
jgi:hypothetical protein